MLFHNLISSFPRAFDPQLGEEISVFFSEIPIETQNLLMAVAGCSPYLKFLMEISQPIQF